MADTVGFGAFSAAETPGILARVAAELAAEREQWFLWVPVLFGFGVAAYFQLSAEPPLAVPVAIGMVFIILHAYGRHLGGWSLVTALLLAVALGFTVAKVRTDLASAPQLPRQIGLVDVAGWVELVEPRATGGQRVTVRVARFGSGAPDSWPVRVRVRFREAHATLTPGQAVRFKATLGPPPLPSAPGDFDFGRQAWFHRLGGIGFSAGASEPDASLGPAPWSVVWRAPIETLRQSIRERIIAQLPGETGEIATALITGERGGISEATNQAYRDSGLFHILSISGLHMVIMAGAVFYVLRLALAAVPRLALRYPIKKWAAAGAIVGAFGYLLISGAAFATVRSYVMITIMFIAVLLDRPALALRNVALAALAILIVFPESLLDPGFQMSFAAVIGLVSAFEWLRRRREALGEDREPPGGAIRIAARFVGQIVLSTVIASIVVAPFGIYHFHNTQLLALVANVFAIPICNVLVMPAALAVLMALPFGLEWLPLAVMGAGIEAMTAVARAVGALPGAVVKVPAIPTHAFVALVLGGLWLLLWQRPWRFAGLIGILTGIALAPTFKKPDALIGRDGTTIAVRGADGRLEALAIRGSAFELGRWLEADGDRRTPAEAASARAFRCDAVGCMAASGGTSMAVAMSPAALRDDCAAADVVVLRFAYEPKCAAVVRTGKPALVIDTVDLARHGAHALFFTPGGVRVETVAGARGQRPWSGPLVAARSPDDVMAGQNRLSGFSGLFERFREARPEQDIDEPR